MGVLFNFAIVLVTGFLGFIIKKGINEKLNNTIMHAMALVVAFIGITGMFRNVDGYETKALISVISLAVGSALGEIIDIDKWLNLFSKKVEDRINKKADGKVDFATGFVNATLLFCVGAMSIVGPINSATSGDNSVLFSKSIIDGVTAFVFASTMGVGVMFSAFPILAFEGAVFLLTSVIAPYLSDAVIAEMAIVGSVIIFGISLNMLKLTKIKIVNLVPSIFVPIILCLFIK